MFVYLDWLVVGNHMLAHEQLMDHSRLIQKSVSAPREGAFATPSPNFWIVFPAETCVLLLNAPQKFSDAATDISTSMDNQYRLISGELHFCKVVFLEL